MPIPLETKISVEKEWRGVDSTGRYFGKPAIFLYYGTGEDRNYTVRSLRNKFDGYNWSRKVASHGEDLVFTSFIEDAGRDAEPLSNRYVDEIVDFLKVQRHGTVRVQTPAYTTPSPKIDDLVDHYTIRMTAERYRGNVDDVHSGDVEWFAGEARKDRADFVIGFDGLKKNRQYLADFSHEYQIPDDRIWVYPEDGQDYSGAIDAVKSSGHRISLPPDYFRLIEDESGD